MVGFVCNGDEQYAGKHLLIDLYNCENVPDPNIIKNELCNICTSLGATVLFGHAHEFHNGGSSGVIILAESHCTWHHWLDEKYIALDIFVCGHCQPEHAITSLVKLFKPCHTKTNLQLRGVMNC